MLTTLDPRDFRHADQSGFATQPPHRVEHVDAHVAKGPAALLDKAQAPVGDAAAADAACTCIVQFTKLAVLD